MDLVKTAHSQGADADAKKDFSLKMARPLTRIGVFARNEEVLQDYVGLRRRQGVRQEKKELRSKHEALAATLAEDAQKEGEEC